LLADRGFIGKKWINYLNNNKLKYHIRIRKNFHVDAPRTCNRFNAFWAFNDLKCGECRFLIRIYRLNGQLCYLSASKIK